MGFFDARCPRIASPCAARRALRIVWCACTRQQRGELMEHARRVGQGDADGMKAAVHQAALQKSQHASVGIGASDSDPAQDKERCCTVRK
jgi:hypothetical protein